MTVGLALFVEAYAYCSTCRSSGFGLGPILHTAIYAWIDRQHPPLDRDVADLVERVVRLVDADTLQRAAVRANMNTK